MARERNIQTRDDGTQYVEVRRSKSFKIEGLGSMVLRQNKQVDLVATDQTSDQESIVEQLLSQASGSDNTAKWRDIAEAVNAGRIYQANIAANSELTKQFNSVEAVQAFAQVASTLGKALEGEPADIAQKLLSMFPEMKTKLDEAGFVFSTDDEEDDDDE